jgi:spermidine synthase
MKIRNNIIYLIAVGFFSILGQVVILRELNVAFYGIELIYILSFAFWLLGTAIGAALGRRSYIPDEKAIHLVFILSAILLIADITFIREIRNIFGGVQGGYLPFTSQIVGLLIALFPIGLLIGLLFQWTAKRFVSTNNTLAIAYAIESAGGVLGALGSTLLLSFGISNFSIGISCSLVLVSVGIFCSLSSANKLLKVVYIISVPVFIVLFALSSRIDILMTSWNHPYLVESADTPYNRVTITSPEKQICVFEDDVLSYETQTISAEEFVQLSTLQSTNVDNVLVLGGGFAGIISELLKLPVKKIDYIEINKGLIGILQKHLPAGLLNSLLNKKVKIIYDDPRRFLRQPHLYDVILVGMPEPMSAQSNRFYTKQFFDQCANSLNEKGILAFKIQSSENIWTRQMTERNAGIYYALRSSLKNVIVLPGVVNIFVASKSKLTRNTKLLGERFIQRNIETKLVSPQYINYIYTNDRYAEIQNLILKSSYNINSDFHPVCYSYTISLWLTKFFPNLTFSENPLSSIPASKGAIYLFLILILFMVIFIVLRKALVVKRITLVFAAGFIGMTVEIILILLYQNKSGILFRDIGILFTAFMVGLSVGSYFINRLFISVNERVMIQKWLGILLFIGFSLLILSIYFLAKADQLSGLPIISIALLLDGTFVSGIFAFISLSNITDQQGVITQLYTADLLGGCLGSLITSLILVPIYGFFLSLILMIVLCLGCLVYVRL